MESTWQAISDLGDSAVTLTLAGAVLFYLTCIGNFRSALIWAMAVGGCGAIIALAKIALLTCGQFNKLASPSGHAAMSAAVFGGIAILAGSKFSGMAKLAPLALALPLIAAISQSRIALQAHSPLEVAVGLGIGLTGIAGIGCATNVGPTSDSRFHWSALAAGALIVLAFYGSQWPVEEAIKSFALNTTHFYCR